MTNQDFLTSDQAAEFLKGLGIPLKKSTLNQYRSNKSKLIPYYKFGRKIAYRKDDLIKWVETQRVDPNIS